MPSNTFWKLPAEKRERIIEAAVDEFAENCFSHASINRIVKAAEISRGSFYQYFDSKEDLYLLVMERIGKEKLAVFSRYQRTIPDTDFFSAIRGAIPAMLEWIEQCPKYNKIGMLMAKDNSEFIRDIFMRIVESQKEFFSMLVQDQDRGLFRKDVDLEVVIELLGLAVPAILQKYYGGDTALALRELDAILDVIGNGIRCREACDGNGGSDR